MNLGRLPFTRETLVDIDVEEEVECGAHRYKGKADLVYRSEGKLMAVLFEWKRNDMTGRPRSMPWTMAYWGAERAVEKRYEQRVSGTMRIDLVTGRDKFCARQSDNMDHRLRQEIAIIGECIERGWLPSMPTTAKCKSCLFEDLCLRYRY